MVEASEVSRQLKRLKVNFQFWCRGEIRELPRVLFEGEQLEHVIMGRYEAGFALFCATDRRVLLIDKKPFYLTIEDVRYDMISDVQYNHRLIDATVRLGTVHKTISFTGYNHNKLRDFTNYIQQQVMCYRQQDGSPMEPNQLQTQNEPQPRTNPAYVVPAIQQAMRPAIAKLISKPKRIMNPYSTPLIIRRRVSRFY